MKKKKYLLLFCLLFAFQAFFIFSIFPTSKDSFNEPLLYRDHAIHLAQAQRMIYFFKNSGKLSGYDPYFMAGYPSTFFDLVDNCGVFVATLILSIFIPLAGSIKIFIFLMLIILPGIMFLTSRNFNLDLEHSFFSAMLLIFVLNIFWFYRRLITFGTYSYLLAVFFAIFSFSYFFVYYKKGKVKYLLAYLIVSFLGFLLHPLFILILSVFSAVYLIFDFRRFDLKRFKNLFIVSLVVIVANLFWLIPLLDSLRYYQPENVFLQPFGLKSLAKSFVDPGNLIFNILLMIALLCPFILRKEKEAPLLWTLGLACLLSFLIAYLNVPLFGSLISNLEPVRFLLISAILTVVLTAKLLSYCPNLKANYFSVGVVVLLIIQAFISGDSNLKDKKTAGMHKFFCSNCVEARINHYRITRKTEELASLIKNLSDKSARILIEDSAHKYWQSNIISLLPVLTDREFIGGPYVHPKIKHHFASFSSSRGTKPRLFGSFIDDISIEEIKGYLDLYNIKWVFVHSRRSKSFFRSYPQTFTLVSKFDFLDIYQVAREASFFIKGKGSIKTSLGRIEISNASRGDIIIKYHYYDKFKTYPEVNIEKIYYLDDPIGFIQLKNPKGYEKIEIYN